MRNQSLGGSQQQSPVLLARIAEKKAELANLKDLQALSGGLADQMQMLADKLSTLSDGTEGEIHQISYIYPELTISQPSRQSFPTGTTSFGQSIWHPVSLLFSLIKFKKSIA